MLQLHHGNYQLVIYVSTNHPPPPWPRVRKPEKIEHLVIDNVYYDDGLLRGIIRYFIIDHILLCYDVTASL